MQNLINVKVRKKIIGKRYKHSGDIFGQEDMLGSLVSYVINSGHPISNNTWDVNKVNSSMTKVCHRLTGRAWIACFCDGLVLRRIK